MATELNQTFWNDQCKNLGEDNPSYDYEPYKVDVEGIEVIVEIQK